MSGGPQTADYVSLEQDELDRKAHFKEVGKKAFKFVASQLGLIILICLYALAGGFIFEHLEETNEKDLCMTAMNSYYDLQNKTITTFLTISNGFATADEAYAMDAILQQLETFRQGIADSGYNGNNCTIMGEDGGPPYQWSLPGSILFATTIFTTVGYGNIAPKTFWGRLVCIAYAILGIPLMLLCLANIGQVMAHIFCYTYLKLCCCGFLKRKPVSRANSRASSATPRPTADESMQAFKDQYEARNSTTVSTNEVMIDEDEEDEEDDQEISVPLTVTLTLVGSYVFMGALLFGYWNEMPWLTAGYFSFITISTIGFGDIVPGTNDLSTTDGKMRVLVTALYMVCGMAVLSMAFNLIQAEIEEKVVWLGERLGICKKEDDDAECGPAVEEPPSPRCKRQPATGVPQAGQQEPGMRPVTAVRPVTGGGPVTGGVPINQSKKQHEYEDVVREFPFEK